MLRVHRAERADRLADALATLVAEAPDDPFAGEIVAVPTRGVERWLAQRLSGHLGARAGRADGVCANVTFPFPGHLVDRAVAAATGVDPAGDPWPAERSVWALLDVVQGHLDEAWLAPLAAHLDPGGDGRSRPFRAVRRLADLFDRYGVHRPAMIRAWAAGEDTDGDDRALPADVVWQAELWRHLRDRTVIPSPAERLATACDRLRDEPAVINLPARLALFGLTRLPASYLDVLHALGAGRDVNLFLLHPSPALWARLATMVDGVGGSADRASDPTAGAPVHPLLAAWGRDAREMQVVLSRAAARHGPGSCPEAHHDGPVIPGEPGGDVTAIPGGPGSLLGRLAADIRADRPPPGPPLPGEPDRRPVLAAGDRSVQVHACHGRARQVEVLRDAVLHALTEDPTLEPRDVVVMCPDIDAFAPLIHATFTNVGVDDPDAPGQASGARPPDLHVRLADRSIRRTNPVLATVAALLDLAGGRVTASQVIDLAGREPVRRRFRLDDDDLARIEEWVAGTGIRWGLDREHRGPYKLDALDAGTWRAGLDRLLVGVTMAEDGHRLVGGVLPLDDVDSGDIDLAGRLAELVDRVDVAVRSFAGARPLAAWADAIADAADALTATADQDAWQRAQLAGLLADVATDEATGRGPAAAGMALDLEEVRALLADRLRGRPTRANFRTGHLTMCTLVPMRSVPHRVVCLLGLDDGAFPRRTAPDGDDVIARAPCVGDHDPRSEDRQLLLDAVLAATETVIVTYSGRDERTNEPRPPAVPLGELLDVIDATVRADQAGTPARARVVQQHPLQPFDRANFTAGALGPARSWSFDRIALAGAEAAARPRVPVPPLLTGRLPPSPAEIVELDDLVRFVGHPVRAFLRQRLGVSVREGDDETADALAVELDHLERWGVGQRLLEALLAGVAPADCRAAELARGLLPPGALGVRIVDQTLPLAADVARVAARVAGEGTQPGSVQIDVDLSGGRSLVGTVPDVAGDLVRTATYSRIGPKQRLTAWVRLLAVAASYPDRPVRAVTVGRGPRGTVGEVGIPAVEPDRAVTVLDRLVDLLGRGLCEPLPLFTKTSEAYAAARFRGRPGDDAARAQWESSGDWEREDREPEHKLALGGIVSFDLLVSAATPAPDEAGAGWAADEPTRFGRLARRLWDDLLTVEQAAAR